LGRMSEPQEVAGTVRWMLSADARGLTGQAVDLNHGAFMN
jgi:NAD(P)-dependent dehydrogenase (short-subunit alcohol dehydrogenase family)